MSCRKALAQLERRGLVRLPQKTNRYGFEGPRRRLPEVRVPVVEGELAELAEIDVKPITSRYSKDSKIWTALLQRFHYLGSGPLCGAQIRYLITSSRYGPIGALAFSSATWALRCRDNYIGWSEKARRQNLEWVICNARFLIVPTVAISNLASHVLSLAVSRVAGDWQQRYGVRPVLVETFVDPSRFTGACYKAANWKEVGQSAGRRDGQPKKVFVYPLCSKWREILCKERQLPLGQGPRPQPSENWAEHEFGRAPIYDGRLKRRLYTLAQDFYAHCEASIPDACQSRGKTIAAYRFFCNSRVSMEVVLTGHLEATIDRIKEHRLVLAPQDTTTLNYSTHPMTTGLGPVNTTTDQSIGLILHDTLAFSEDGTPLGIIDAQCWARDPKNRGKRYRRHELPIELKESYKWLRSFQKLREIQRACPDTLLVSIGDRESDIYELFREATQHPDGPALLIRSEKSRNRKTKDGKLWDLMAREKVAGLLKIHIPRRGPKKARDTWVELRFRQVELKAPQRQPKGSAPVRLWAVYVREQPRHAEGNKSIEWMLLTTVAVNSFEDAKKRVEWYSARWGIEVYHRTLKSGCRIKDRQLGTAERIQNCLGIDMVVAWRIYHLTMLGRETPEVSCTVFFKDVEWKALCCYVHRSTKLPDKPPTLSEAIRMVATIGGYLGRKRDGPPGTKVLWRGLQKLDTATEMYAIFTQQHEMNPFASGP